MKERFLRSKSRRDGRRALASPNTAEPSAVIAELLKGDIEEKMKGMSLRVCVCVSLFFFMMES